MTLDVLQERSHVAIPQDLHSQIMNRIAVEKRAKETVKRGPSFRVSKGMALAAAIFLIFITSGNLLLFSGQPHMSLLMSEDAAQDESFGIASEAESLVDGQEIRGSDESVQEEGIEEVPQATSSDDGQEARTFRETEEPNLWKVWEVVAFNVGALVLGASVYLYMRRKRSSTQ